MRHFSLKALLIAALSIGCSLSGFAENAYWAEFGNQPVYIQQVNGRSKQTLKFIDYKDSMLVAEITIDGGVGEMSLPVSESMVKTLRLDLGEIQKANQLINGATTLVRSKYSAKRSIHWLNLLRCRSCSANYTPRSAA